MALSERMGVLNSLSSEQAFIHLVKAMLGTGLLSLPLAFKHAGLWLGLGLMIVICLVCLHCMRMVVHSAHFVCERRNLEAIDYANVMRYSVECGPLWIKNRGYFFKQLVNVNMFLCQLGFCCVYFVFMSANLQDFFAKNSPLDLHQRVWMLILLVPMLLICSIRQLKILAPLGVTNLSAVMLTHDHADATLGLDDLREFKGVTDKSGVDVWCDDRTLQTCKRVFPYLYEPDKATGLFVASINWKVFNPMNEMFEVIPNAPIFPLPVLHGPEYLSNGFAIPTPNGSLVYISDISELPADTRAKIDRLGKVHILVLDLLSIGRAYNSHFEFNQTVTCAKTIPSDYLYVVGMSHTAFYDDIQEKLQRQLPDRKVVTGYDGAVMFDATAKAASSL